MMQKYYRIKFIPDARGKFGSIRAIELWTESQIIAQATEMVRNDLNSPKINFELQKVKSTGNSYDQEMFTYEVIDTDRQKYLGQVIATTI